VLYLISSSVINIGETRTRGFEWQALGKLTPQWRMIAGYAYLDAKLIDDGPDLFNDGNRLGGTPAHSFNLWTVYEPGGAWQGLGLGGGVFAQSRVPIGFENRSFYSGWAQVDLSAYYKRDKWKAQLNIKNVGDREYLLTQALAFEDLAAVRVGTATPRTVMFSVAREF
jgi:iron complex outermembrane recepter protein